MPRAQSIKILSFWRTDSYSSSLYYSINVMFFVRHGDGEVQHVLSVLAWSQTFWSRPTYWTNWGLCSAYSGRQGIYWPNILLLLAAPLASRKSVFKGVRLGQKIGVWSFKNKKNKNFSQNILLENCGWMFS